MSNGQGENLTIFVVVLVVLAVILGGTTYLFYSKMDQTQQSLEEAKKELEDQTSLAANYQRQTKDLLRVVGTPDLEPVVALKKSKTFIVDNLQEENPPTSDQNFPTVVEEMNSRINKLKTQLATEQNERKLVSEQLEKVKEAVQTEAEQHEKNWKKEVARVKKLDDQYRKDRTKAQKENQKLRTEREEIRVTLMQVQRTSEDTEKDLQAKIRRLGDIITKLTEERERTQLVNLQVADGKVVRSEAASGVVYLDLGRKDRVKPGFLFSVYGRNEAGDPYHQSKASVIIKKILDENMSMATVTEHDPNSPIVVGDRVYNPLYDRDWVETFAIAGHFDLNGDGKDDRDQLVELIHRHGGKLVCELLPDGTVKGSIGVNTSWLVLGEPPTDEEIAEAKEEDREELTKQMQSIERVRDEARSVGVSILNAKNFLRYMGYVSPNRLTVAQSPSR